MLKEILRHTHFPYCLMKLEDGTYVITNRNYKPLGNQTSEWVNYEESGAGIKLKGLTPKIAAKLDYKGREDVDRIYLYNDGCAPTIDKQCMEAYMKRLEVLMKIKIAADD